MLKGKEITVEFSRPVALQIDGETILNVSSYTATANYENKIKDEGLIKSIFRERF